MNAPVPQPDQGFAGFATAKPRNPAMDLVGSIVGYDSNPSPEYLDLKRLDNNQIVRVRLAEDIGNSSTANRPSIAKFRDGSNNRRADTKAPLGTVIVCQGAKHDQEAEASAGMPVYTARWIRAMTRSPDKQQVLANLPISLAHVYDDNGAMVMAKDMSGNPTKMPVIVGTIVNVPAAKTASDVAQFMSLVKEAIANPGIDTGGTRGIMVRGLTADGTYKSEALYTQKDETPEASTDRIISMIKDVMGRDQTWQKMVNDPSGLRIEVTPMVKLYTGQYVFNDAGGLRGDLDPKKYETGTASSNGTPYYGYKMGHVVLERFVSPEGKVGNPRILAVEPTSGANFTPVVGFRHVNTPLVPHASQDYAEKPAVRAEAEQAAKRDAEVESVAPESQDIDAMVADAAASLDAPEPPKTDNDGPGMGA